MSKIALTICLLVAVLLAIFVGKVCEKKDGLTDFSSFKNVQRFELDGEKALSGSIASSQKLALIYEDCAAGFSTIKGITSEECLNNAKYWSLIDLENGGSLGVSERYNELVSSNKCSEAIRAIYWVKKSNNKKYLEIGLKQAEAHKGIVCHSVKSK